MRDKEINHHHQKIKLLQKKYQEIKVLDNF
jgi:hypothetical protein